MGRQGTKQGGSSCCGKVHQRTHVSRKSKGSIAKGELGSLRSLGYSPTMRLLAVIAALALLAGCGASKHTATTGISRAIRQIEAVCREEHISDCRAIAHGHGPTRHTSTIVVGGDSRPREIERRVRERPPTFTGPNGNTLPPVQAAAAARRLEAQCRKEHAPCTALGGVQLRTQRYKVQIK